MFNNYKNKIKVFVENNYPIIIILLIGFAIRWYGIYFDYPRTNFIWDETYDMAYLMNLLEQRSFFVKSVVSSYPLVLPLLYAPVTVLRIIYIALANGLYGTEAFKNHVIEFGIGEIYIVSRWYAVFFGTATIFLLYKIYNLIFKNKISSYYAALAYCFSLIPVMLSHWGKHHSVMVFFLILSLLFILKFERDKNLKYFYWSIAASALSFSTHYVGIAAAVFPLWGFLQNRKFFNLKKILKSSALFLSIASFFYLMNYNGVRWMATEMFNNYYAKNSYLAIVPTGKWERFYYLFRDSFKIEPIFVSLFAIMVFTQFKILINNRFIRYILVGLGFVYIIMITVVVGPRMTRWLLTFLTLAVPLVAGLFIEYLFNKNYKKIFIYSIALLLILPSIFFTGRWLSLLKTNTNIEAEEWLVKNVNKNEYIYSFNDYLYTPLSYQAALWNKENNQMDNLKKNNYILENKEYFENKGVNLMYDRKHGRYEDLAGDKTRYVVLSYGRKGENEEMLKNLKNYHHLELKLFLKPTEDEKLFKRGIGEYLNNPENWLDLLSLKKSGPFVEIYQVR